MTLSSNPEKYLWAAITSIHREYCPLPETCVKELKAFSSILFPKKSDQLVKEGQLSGQCFFIIEGAARAFYLKDGKDISDYFAFENDFISSINSFFLDIPSPHIIELIEDSVLLSINRKDIIYLSNKYHAFEKLNGIVVTKTMLQLSQRIMASQFESAAQKYENLIRLKPDITLRVPLGHIDSYLGITLETLSRIRGGNMRI